METCDGRDMGNEQWIRENHIQGVGEGTFGKHRFVDGFRAGSTGPARKLSTNLYDIYHC